MSDHTYQSDVIIVVGLTGRIAGRAINGETL